MRRTARTALESGLSGVLVVVGCRAAEVRREVEDLAIGLVENPRFEEGQSTSVRAALDELPVEVGGAMFIPCDQPLLDTATVQRLLENHLRSPDSIVVPTHLGNRGAPVIVPRALFEEMRRMEGDAGARQLFGGWADRLLEVELPDGRPLLDIDTPADLRRLREKVFRERVPPSS